MKTNVHFYIISMSSYPSFSRWSAYIFNYINTLHCTCTKWLYSINTRFHSLSNDWPASPVFTSSRPVGRSVGNAARSRRLWTMRLCTFTWRRHLRKQHNKKIVTICTVTKDVETSRLDTYTYPHSFTPLASKASIPQRCGRNYTKDIIASQRSCDILMKL